MILTQTLFKLKEKKLSFERVFSIGLAVFILSYFLPISNKASNNIFYGLVLVPCLIAMVKKRDIFKTGELFPYFLVMVGTMTLIAFPDEPKAIKYAVYLIGFWLVTSTVFARNYIDSDRAAIWLMLIATLFCIALLIDHTLLQGNPIALRPSLYQTWRSGNPIMACMLLSLFTVVGLSVLIKDKRYILSTCLLVSSLILQSLFQTRSGFVGYVAVLATYPVAGILMETRHNIRHTVWFMAVVGGLVFLLYQLGLFTALIEKGDSFRLELFQVSLEHYSQCSVMTGCGYNYDFDDVLQNGLYIDHPHSIYMSALVYLGPLSLLALLVLLVRAFLTGIKIKTNWLWGLIASSAFFLVDGSKILNNPSIIWICLLFPLAVIDGLSREDQASQK